MPIDTINVRIRLKHLWLLKAINVPLLLVGLTPCVPRFFVSAEIE